MKRILSFLLLCTLCLATFLPVAATPVAQNAMVASTQSAIEASLGRDTAGAAILLVDQGKRVMMEGFGYADMEERSLVTVETSFEIGSLSSLFVLLAVRNLQRDGVLDPDVSIAEYLSASFMEKLALSYDVTLNDLLYGTAGFDGRLFDLRVEKDVYRFDTLGEALLADVPSQIARPGAYQAYSAFGVGLAAYVVECVVDTSYEEYVRSTILEPLGMGTTLLNPDADDFAQTAAKGHKKVDIGEFVIEKGEGRSYAVLAPVNGAVSTLADLSVLLSHMTERGLFDVAQTEGAVLSLGALGGSATKHSYTLTDTTAYFGSALSVNLEKGQIALVLTNNKESALLSLPALLCGATTGVEVVQEGLLPVSGLEGVYADATFSSNTLLGRLRIKDRSVRITEAKDGMIRFDGCLLIQVAPGVFAETIDEENIVVLQIFTDGDGEVVSLIDATGTTYLPVPTMQRSVPANILFALLILIALYFFVYAIVETIRFLCKKGTPGMGLYPYFALAYKICFGVLSVMVLLQAFIALLVGSAAFASFFTAMAIFTTVLAAISGVSVIVCLFASRQREKKDVWLIVNASLLIAFLVLCVYWRVM